MQARQNGKWSSTLRLKVYYFYRMIKKAIKSTKISKFRKTPLSNKIELKIKTTLKNLHVMKEIAPLAKTFSGPIFSHSQNYA